MSFYVTLPSDASMNYFENNKVSSYITRLPKTIDLQNGEWEVGLCEINYPHTWFNVNGSNNYVDYIFPGPENRFRHVIPSGFYPTVPHILDALSIEKFENQFSFSFNEITKRVEIKVYGESGIAMCSGLSELLGFPSMEMRGTINAEGKLEYLTVESKNISDPCARFRVLMIYTDIIEPQIVGDVFAPLLRIVNVTGHHGDMIHVQYDKPHYLPVSRNIIETIEINIRTHTGELVPFERGRSYVKLHFRQKSLQ